MRTWLLLLALAVAAPARADDCDLLDPAPGTGATQIAQAIDRGCVEGSAAGECGDRIVNPPPRERHGLFAAGDATLGTRGEVHSDRDSLTGAELAASGHAGWRAGPQACLSTDLIAGNERRGDTQFHVVMPWPFFATGLFGFDHQWQLRPHLSDARVYVRRLYSSTEFQAGVAPVAWAHQDGGAAAVLATRVSALQRDQDVNGAELDTMRISLYESTHPDRHTEVLPVTITSMYPYVPRIGSGEPDPLPSSQLVRADAFDLSRRHGDFTYDVAIGALFASRPIRMPVAGALGIAWGPWSARVSRSAFLAMDDSITIENRASAAYHDGRWRAGAFAAVTHASDQPRAQVTGGGSAGVDVTLPEEVKLAVDVEVARSYYARLDADPLPRPELAGLGTVQLSRTFTFNPTAH